NRRRGGRPPHSRHCRRAGGLSGRTKKSPERKLRAPYARCAFAIGNSAPSRARQAPRTIPTHATLYVACKLEGDLGCFDGRELGRAQAATEERSVERSAHIAPARSLFCAQYGRRFAKFLYDRSGHVSEWKR